MFDEKHEDVFSALRLEENFRVWKIKGSLCAEAAQRYLFSILGGIRGIRSN